MNNQAEYDAVCEIKFRFERERGYRFLKKFWIPQDEYHSVWQPLQQQIFSSINADFPDICFNKSYEWFTTTGGGVFPQKELFKYYKLMESLNEEYIIILEPGEPNTKNSWYPIRLKIPINTLWEDLLESKGFISTEVFEFGNSQFQVFGSSGKWARIIANNWWPALHIFGFQPAYAHFFTEVYRETESMIASIIEEVPENYRKFR